MCEFWHSTRLSVSRAGLALLVTLLELVGDRAVGLWVDRQQLLPGARTLPDVQAELNDSGAILSWPEAATPGAARLELPLGLRWSLHRGETDPILGWYSPGLGRRVPAFTLLGCGRCVSGTPLVTRLEFLEVGDSERATASRWTVSWGASAARSGKTPEFQAEAR